MRRLTIAPRFAGPPGAANGGYAAGRIAAFVPCDRGLAVRVRLEAPVPLEAPLTVTERTATPVEVTHEGTVVARATTAGLDLDVPDCPSLAAATAASERSVAHTGLFFPDCFVCGNARDPADGLRIFAGPTGSEADVVAAPWLPHATLDAGDGSVAAEFVWAALDCPGAFAAQHDNRPMLLGQMTAQLERPLPVDETAVVIGWRTAPAAGRKHEVGTALFDARGVRCATAHAIWIQPR